MRHLTFAALAAVAVVCALATTSAHAGYRNYVICWIGIDGANVCKHLPNRYHLRGVSKPVTRDGTVSFMLTSHRIRALGRYIDTSEMFPGQQAAIYAPKHLKRHHRRRDWRSHRRSRRR